MLIQFNTDANIEGTEGMAQQAEAVIHETLGHLADHLTRIEVHLSDANSDSKEGPADKRCLLEARPARHQPVAVSHQAATVTEALDGAVDKLKRALETLFGRLAVR